MFSLGGKEKISITDFVGNLGTRYILPKSKSFVNGAPPERGATEKELDVRRGTEKGNKGREAGMQVKERERQGYRRQAWDNLR